MTSPYAEFMDWRKIQATEAPLNSDQRVYMEEVAVVGPEAAWRVNASKGVINRSLRLVCATLDVLLSSHLLARLQDDAAVSKTRKCMLVEYRDTVDILHSMDADCKRRNLRHYAYKPVSQ